MKFNKTLPILATMLTTLTVAGCGGGRNTLNIFDYESLMSVVTEIEEKELV